jgi:hypothetical protein
VRQNGVSSPTVLIGTILLFLLLSSINIARTQNQLSGQATSTERSTRQPPRANTTSTTRAEELRNVAEEDAELDYLYSVHEVDSSDYQLTKGRHFVLKRYLQALPADIDVPELYVMTRSEMKNFFHVLPNPERLRNGVRIEEHWVYRGKMSRTHIFYIFERQ